MYSALRALIHPCMVYTSRCWYVSRHTGSECRPSASESKMPLLRENQLTKLPPKAPSGLIKSGRYTMLGLGIVYGMFRLEYLTKKEKQIQADEKDIRNYIELKKKEIKDYLSAGEEYFLWKSSNIGKENPGEFVRK